MAALAPLYRAFTARRAENNRPAIASFNLVSRRSHAAWAWTGTVQTAICTDKKAVSVGRCQYENQREAVVRNA
jgi:hypothetical protein